MEERQKFHVSFEHEQSQDGSNDQATPASSFVGDILERDTSTNAAPPSAPTLKNATGFPAHTKRSVPSRFKQKMKNETKKDAPPATPATSDDKDTSGSADPLAAEKQQIDQENRERLAAMSEEEIEEARRELLNSLDPAFLQSLLKRGDIADGSNEAADLRKMDEAPQVTRVERLRRPDRRVTFEEDDEEASEEDTPATQDVSEPQDSIHFPRPPQPPDLDPNSETFLEDLHSKYFPSLPSDPSKLEWMRDSKKASSYDPSSNALNPRDIRFDFKGALIPPSEAAQIPVSAGLHHHGDAPEAAGYTIPELAHLSRSIYAPQRCIAFQTLGRILYKLGKKEFGDPGEPGGNTPAVEDTMGELARGLWREVEAEHVIPQLVAESEGNGVDGGKHLSAKAYATEAVWLWQRGGGRRWKAD